MMSPKWVSLTATPLAPPVWLMSSWISLARRLVGKYQASQMRRIAVRVSTTPTPKWVQAWPKCLTWSPPPAWATTIWRTHQNSNKICRIMQGIIRKTITIPSLIILNTKARESWGSPTGAQTWPHPWASWATLTQRWSTSSMAATTEAARWGWAMEAWPGSNPPTITHRVLY